MARNPGTTRPGATTALIAVVDDDASVRSSTCRLVRSFGYRAQPFESGEAFLTSSAVDETTCLLLDVRMPGMDGLEVQRRLVDRGERLAILFLTAQASDDEERRARAAGAVEFLRKPVGQASLRRALEQVIPSSGSIRGDRDGE